MTDFGKPLWLERRRGIFWPVRRDDLNEVAAAEVGAVHEFQYTGEIESDCRPRDYDGQDRWDCVSAPIGWCPPGDIRFLAVTSPGLKIQVEG